MDNRRVRPHRLFEVEYGWHLLVVNVYEIDRRLRRVFIDGGHGCNALTNESHTFASQDRHVLEVAAVEPGSHVFAGDNGEDARQRLRGRRVHVYDASVGVGAVEHLAPENTFQWQVRRINGTSCDLVDAVNATDGLPQNVICHDRPPASARQHGF